MLEQNAHRLMMSMLGVVVLGLIIGVLFVAGSNPNDNAKEDASFYEQTTESLAEQNQNRTPKY